MQKPLLESSETRRPNAKLPQAFPNNKWVRRLEVDIGLKRNKDKHGIIKWTMR